MRDGLMTIGEIISLADTGGSGALAVGWPEIKAVRVPEAPDEPEHIIITTATGAYLMSATGREDARRLRMDIASALVMAGAPSLGYVRADPDGRRSVRWTAYPAYRAGGSVSMPRHAPYAEVVLRLRRVTEAVA